ncbi:MAG: hypothetical protein ABL907_03050, partial [Hyphomicrobium sp.]
GDGGAAAGFVLAEGADRRAPQNRSARLTRRFLTSAADTPHANEPAHDDEAGETIRVDETHPELQGTGLLSA